MELVCPIVVITKIITAAISDINIINLKTFPKNPLMNLGIIKIP